MRTNFKMENQNITMTKGDTLSFGVQCEDQEGEPIEFDTAYFTCKKNPSDIGNIFKKSLDNGITYNDEGAYIVRVAPEDTAQAEIGRYYYDLEVGVGDDIFTILKGILEVEQDIS